MLRHFALTIFATFAIDVASGQVALAGDAAATDAVAHCVPFPDSTFCVVTFADPARDRITISPNGTGDTFQSVGITVHVRVRRSDGRPETAIPREEIQLYNPGLCICPGGTLADAPTDSNGDTTFTGTIRGGGCVNSLTLYACGFQLCTVPLKTNSWDALPASPCFVDAGDVAAFTPRLGSRTGDFNYSICSDFNEDGFIDAGDLASLSAELGAACP